MCWFGSACLQGPDDCCWFSEKICLMLISVPPHCLVIVGEANLVQEEIVEIYTAKLSSEWHQLPRYLLASEISQQA